MKQKIKFMAIVMLSVAIAFCAASALAETLKQFAAIAIFGSIFVAVVIGAFGVKECTRYESIKHKYGVKKAA